MITNLLYYGLQNTNKKFNYLLYNLQIHLKISKPKLRIKTKTDLPTIEQNGLY